VTIGSSPHGPQRKRRFGEATFAAISWVMHFLCARCANLATVERDGVLYCVACYRSLFRVRASLDWLRSRYGKTPSVGTSPATRSAWSSDSRAWTCRTLAPSATG